MSRYVLFASGNLESHKGCGIYNESDYDKYILNKRTSIPFNIITASYFTLPYKGPYFDQVVGVFRSIQEAKLFKFKFRIKFLELLLIKQISSTDVKALQGEVNKLEKVQENIQDEFPELFL